MYVFIKYICSIFLKLCAQIIETYNAILTEIIIQWS